MHKKAWLLVIGAVALLNAGVIGALALSGDDDGRKSAILAAAEGEAEEEEEGGLGPAEPDDYFLFQRSSGGELPATADFARAVRQAQAVRAEGAAATSDRNNRWVLEGPTNIGGRLTDLAIHPTQPDTVYVAAATGGVWKTTDGGRTMQKAWPDDGAQSMGSIAIGPDGVIWAGTGELNPGGGSITFGGTGVYRSENDGRTWRHVGLPHSGTTGEIVVDPTDPLTVYVAAGGSLFNPGGERGIYKTTNGGATWRRVLDPATPFTGGADLVMDPRDPDRLYAAMWDHRREPDVRTYGGVGSGLFRTDDGGATWTRLENVVSAPTTADPTGLVSDASLGRIGVALAPGNPDRVYVITTATFGQDKGFFVSDDGGDSFTRNTLPGSQGGFGWWFGRIWVDPEDQDHVFVAGVNLRQSFNGGTTWGTSQGLHADQHAMEWDAKVPNRVYEGNDGGLYRSDADGATQSWVKASYEPYTQHYQVEVAETDPSRVTGGTQDNGCIRSWGGAAGQWRGYGCGDGEYVPIDWSDERIFYGCSQYGACTRYIEQENGSLVGDSIRNSPPQAGETPPASARWNWHAPLVIDPNDPQVLYFAGNQLNRSTDRGETWTALSPPHPDDLTGFFDPGRDDPIYRNWGTITTVAVSKTAPETIYLGTDTGRLWKTDDLGATWTEFLGKGLPKRWITRAAVDPEDEDVAYVTFSGFRNGEDAAHVFRTTDGGETWRNISGNLPNAPVNDVVLNTQAPGTDVYVGTDVGVFVREGDRGQWKAVGRDLPLAPVLDLRLHEPTQTLYAGTFGRSAWKVGL